MTVTSEFTEIDQPETPGERTLTFSIEVSPNATDRTCGNCRFVMDDDGGLYCELFGNEKLFMNEEGRPQRVALCRHIERTEEAVTDEDQKPWVTNHP